MTGTVVQVAAVTVPATSANLGPGFDCLGLALDLRDEYRVEVVGEPGVRVRTVGECSDSLPRDESHLVARSLLTALEGLGLRVPGVRLSCRNTIPQGKGLGSSAAAIVGGVALGFALAADIDAHRDDILQLAAEVEGHPDNVAAAVLGGFTVSWLDEAGGRARAVTLPVAAALRAVLFIPQSTSPTQEARAVLPAQVTLASAVHNSARSALLVAAMTREPDLLLAATSDRLHQEQRRATYPEAMALVDRLRADGVAAAISGAGPSVLALSASPGDEGSPGKQDYARTPHGGYRMVPVGIGTGVAATHVADVGYRSP